ncbi:unnamed protein product [Fraxinus pennsylvanica]|uniref:U1-type domain-containing protein n=1 Tax=Fraxinus pennsylvanica TaxID=56036 RepID=A0AAD1YY06_9LAMI|nr:unnamed protein product [Fraxinus pennsylvanica]
MRAFQSLYRSRGRRPFRGRRGQGNLSMRGKARNWGMGGPTIQSHESSSSHPETSTAETAGSTEEKANHTADDDDDNNNNNNNKEAGGLPARTTEIAQDNAALNQRPNQFAWCEICRVQCTSLDILVQHNNGKRHKKNLQRLEESKDANISVAEILDRQTPIGVFSPEVTLKSDNLLEGEENEQIPSKNLPKETVSSGSMVESEQKNDQSDHPDIPIERQPNMPENIPELNWAFNQRHVWKRNMQGGRGGKRMKTSDTRRQPPKPKVVVIPLICDLCNVKCDTREVFDRHLSGKKHISKLKRYEGHQAMYGPQGLQALYPPNPVTQTLYARPGLQETLTASQNIPPGLNMPSQAHYAATTAMDTPLQQNPNF